MQIDKTRKKNNLKTHLLQTQHNQTYKHAANKMLLIIVLNTTWTSFLLLQFMTLSGLPQMDPTPPTLSHSKICLESHAQLNEAPSIKAWGSDNLCYELPSLHQKQQMLHLYRTILSYQYALLYIFSEAHGGRPFLYHLRKKRLQCMKSLCTISVHNMNRRYDKPKTIATSAAKLASLQLYSVSRNTSYVFGICVFLLCVGPKWLCVFAMRLSICICCSAQSSLDHVDFKFQKNISWMVCMLEMKERCVTMCHDLCAKNTNAGWTQRQTPQAEQVLCCVCE